LSKPAPRAHLVARLTVLSLSPESAINWRVDANPCPVRQSIRIASIVRAQHWAAGGRLG
jgi:hypothetical protein